MVGDVNRPAFEQDTPGAGVAPRAHPQLPHDLLVLRRLTETGGNFEHVARGTQDVGSIGIAQAASRLDQRVEHRLQIKGRAADDLVAAATRGAR